MGMPGGTTASGRSAEGSAIPGPSLSKATLGSINKGQGAAPPWPHIGHPSSTPKPSTLLMPFSSAGPSTVPSHAGPGPDMRQTPTLCPRPLRSPCKVLQSESFPSVVLGSALRLIALAERKLIHSHRHTDFQLLLVSWLLKPMFLAMD